MTSIDLQKVIESCLQSALSTEGEIASSNGYQVRVDFDSLQEQGHFDFIPNYPVKYPVDKVLNDKILSILSGALYPALTLFTGGPNFVKTNSSNFSKARALRFYFKTGTYSRMIIDNLDTSYIYDGCLPLMEGFKYDFKHNSGHIAISGASGNGKSVFAEYMLSQFWLIGAKIVIVDPKLDHNLWHFAQKKEIEYHYPHVGDNPNTFSGEVTNTLSKAINVIGKRQSSILKGKEVDFNPYIVFIDEAAAFSTKQSRELMEKIVLMGRACKVWLFISAQAMDATNVISSIARDSMGLKIVLSSNPSSEDCRYLFKNFDPSDVVIPRDEYKFGVGLIEQKSDGRIVPFLAPYIANIN